MRISYIWIIFLFGTLIFTVRENVDVAASFFTIEKINRYIALPIIFLFSFRFLSNKKLNKKIINHPIIKILILFGVFQILSSIWSINPAYTLFRSVEYFGSILLVIISIHYIKNFRPEKFLINWHYFLIISVWIGLILNPSGALKPAESSIFGFMLHGNLFQINANSVSQFSGALILFFLIKFLHKKTTKFDYVLFPFIILTIILAQGRTGIAALILAIIIYAITKRLITRFVLVLALPLTVLFAFNSVDILEYLERGQTTSNIETFSGRLNYWQYGFLAFYESPILGNGAYSGVRFKVLPMIDDSTLSSLHNSWVDLLVNNGLFGFILMLILVLILLKRLFNGVRKGALFSYEFSIYFSVMIISLFRSFFSNAFVYHSDFIFFLIIIGVVSNDIFYKNLNRP